MIKHKKKSNTAALVAYLIIAGAAIVGILILSNNLLSQGTSLLSMAADLGNKVVCYPSDGDNEFNSNKMTVVNNTGNTVNFQVQKNVCPNNYKNPDTDGTKIKNKKYQCNNWLDTQSVVLAPGQSGEYVINVPFCQVGQLDIKPNGFGCYKKKDGKLWSGGLAFTMKADSTKAILKDGNANPQCGTYDVGGYILRCDDYKVRVPNVEIKVYDDSNGQKTWTMRSGANGHYTTKDIVYTDAVGNPLPKMYLKDYYMVYVNAETIPSQYIQKIKTITTNDSYDHGKKINTPAGSSVYFSQKAGIVDGQKDCAYEGADANGMIRKYRCDFCVDLPVTITPGPNTIPLGCKCLSQPGSIGLGCKCDSTSN